MTTECFIGVVKHDNTVVSIRVHRDGYLEHVAPILLNYYNTELLALQLVELGELVDLGTQLVDGTDACVAYHRDRGEPLQQYIMNAIDYKAFMYNNSIMHNYMFIIDRWYYFDLSGTVEVLDEYYAHIQEENSV